jgi:hypothetical protein
MINNLGLRRNNRIEANSEFLSPIPMRRVHLNRSWNFLSKMTLTSGLFLVGKNLASQLLGNFDRF